MAHDVFISYSTKDKTISDAVCAKLEENGIRTWIAPRDVPAGTNFAEAIIDAIDNCKAFVLIWSGNANASKHILNEINRAFDRGIPIIPFRIQDVQPSSAMSYYLGNTHWLDAYEPSWENHLNKLIRTVSSNLDIRPIPEKTVSVAADPPQHPPKRIGLTQILLGLAGITVIALAIWYGLTKMNIFEDRSFTEETDAIEEENRETQEIMPSPAATNPVQEEATEEPESDPCQIVFQSLRDGVINLWLIEPDGSNLTRLTYSQESDIVGSWTPDGSEFIFFSWRDGDSEIYVMDISGSNIRQLTNNEFNDSWPKLSPDGKTIAFYSDRGGSQQIYLMDKDGSNPRQLTHKYGWLGQNYDPGISASLDWSPDGERIVFISDYAGTPDLWIFWPNTGVSEDESVDLLNEDLNTSFELEPVWSPDFENIAFVSNRYGDYEIFLFKDNKYAQLTSNEGISTQPAWSPDGSRIAFTSDRTGDPEIWIMNADGSNQHQITFSEGYDGAPIWSPLCR